MKEMNKANKRNQENIMSERVNYVSPIHPDILRSKQVVVKFKCKKCGKKFLASVDGEMYKYVLNDPLFLKSKTCSSCKVKTVKNILGRRKR